MNITNNNLLKKLKNTANQVSAIAESFTYLFKDIDTEREQLRKERLEVCKSCPLFQKTETRSRCNPNLMINPETGQVVMSTAQNQANYPNFVSGCGCTLDNYGNPLGEKTTIIGKGNTCPANKWNKVESDMLEIKGDHEINQDLLKTLGLTNYADHFDLTLVFKNDPDKTEL